MKLIKSLEAETGQSTGFKEIGYLQLASTPEWLEERRRMGVAARRLGVNYQEISPSEVKKLWPLAETSDILAGFYTPWVLANVAGWLIWGVLNFALLVIAPTVNLPGELGLLISRAFLAAIGAILGGAQWRVLRRQVPQASRWIIFSTLGFAVATFIDLMFAGLGVGLMQWVLRRSMLNTRVNLACDMASLMPPASALPTGICTVNF